MGKLLVIDGLDGSGKKTQVMEVANYIKNKGKDIYIMDFPDYLSRSSMPVRMYLSGELGKDPMKLNPYLCSTFFAVDRGIQFIKLYDELYNRDNAVLISNRYISANIIHQGCKIKDIEEREKFFEWAYDTEINKYGLPSDDLTLILSVPVETSISLMNKRYSEDESKKDIHESNVKYLKECYDTAQHALKYFKEKGRNWQEINCLSSDGKMKSVEEIRAQIIEIVETVI